MTHMASCRAAGDQVWITGDLIGGSQGGAGAVFHGDGQRWSKQTFRLAGARDDRLPLVVLGRVGTEAWVMDQHGALYRSSAR
jgi:hypothetical protein